MGKLSTHVLDISTGQPGQGIQVELYEVGINQKKLLKQDTTNADGRCTTALLQGSEFRIGRYELVFAAGDYFSRQGHAFAEPRFIDRVTISFGIADPAQNYHVPLLVSPWAYSTYRGS